MISVRTLGTSEKKVRATTPATTPNDAAVAPLFRETMLDVITSVLFALCAIGPGMIPSPERNESTVRRFLRPRPSSSGEN